MKSYRIRRRKGIVAVLPGCITRHCKADFEPDDPSGDIRRQSWLLRLPFRNVKQEGEGMPDGLTEFGYGGYEPTTPSSGPMHLLGADDLYLTNLLTLRESVEEDLKTNPNPLLMRAKNRINGLIRDHTQLAEA